MKYMMIKPRFARMVSLGNKLMTIRPTPKRPHRRGDLVQLRMWQARPYASKQLPLADVRILHAYDVEIHANWRGDGPAIINNDLQTADGLGNYYYHDGFDSKAEMLAFFKPPFRGVLYFWEYLAGYECPISPCAGCTDRDHTRIACILRRDCWNGMWNNDVKNPGRPNDRRNSVYYSGTVPGFKYSCDPTRRHVTDGGTHNPDLTPSSQGATA